MTHETVPTNRRIYMVMQAMPGGMMQFRLSAMPPHYDDPAAVLLVRGVLPQGDDVVLQIVSDPSANPSLRGKDGTNGTNGANGRDGVDGKNGADGKAGSNGLDGKAGTNGVDGQSAYDIARSLGYGGTKTQWLASLVGAAGRDGTNGTNGTNGKDGAAGAQGPAGFGTVAPATPSRVFGTAFQPSKDKAVLIALTVKTQVTNPLLAGSSAATAKLFSDAANPPTIERARAEATSGVGLAVSIALTTSNTSQLVYLVPAGHWVLLTQTVAGTGSVAIVTQSEATLG